MFFGGDKEGCGFGGEIGQNLVCPPQRNAVWRGHLSIFPPQTWRGQPILVVSPPTLEGTENPVPPTSEMVGGTLCPPQTWGGHLGGTDFALGGKFHFSVPPNWGGNVQLCYALHVLWLIKNMEIQ